MAVWKRFSSIVCSIYPQAVFTGRFVFRIEYLVLVKLDVADSDDLTVLWDPYSINVAPLIADQVANMCPRLSFVGRSVFIAFHHLLPHGIGFTPISLDVSSVWLVHEVCHVFVVGSKILQKCFTGRFPAVLISRRPIVNIGRCLPRFRP
jgi:hypothetical protein